MNQLLDAGLNRRQLLKGAGSSVVALGAGGLLAGCGGSGSGSGTGLGTAANDKSILQAAQIAEALATTMYTAIINGPVFAALASNVPDQQYLTAARDEEKYHYDLLKGALSAGDTQTTFWFPTGMFTDKQTTINVLVTLEEAFIAAYLIGIAQFTTAAGRQLAGQIMGVEAEHRTLARVIGNDLGLATTTGLSGSPQPVEPSNNTVYEGTFGLHNISQVVTALTPFLSQSATNTVQAPFDPTYEPTGAGLVGNPPS
ncbi:MAG: ferritin-like domain-containing protein [Fimbriimonadaceae bacterium]